MAPPSTERDEVLRHLQGTPRHIERLAAGRSDAQLRRPPSEGSWSAHEIVAHLRGCADVQGGWIARMLAETNPTIRYSSPRTGMRKTGYEAESFAAFLERYAQQRAELVRTLTSLEPGEWMLRASFTGTTPGWTQTVLDVARGLVTHERSHLEQLRTAVEGAS